MERDEGWLPGPDPDDEGREMHVEFREAQAELERAALEEARGQRDLVEVLLEFFYRGDEVRVFAGGREWSGTVVHVAGTLVTVQTAAGGEVDIAVGAVTAVRVVRRSRSKGRSRIARAPASLEDRLQQVYLDEAVVSVGGERLTAVEGTVEVIGVEHVEVRAADGSEWVLALDAIDYVVRAPEPRPRWARPVG